MLASGLAINVNDINTISAGMNTCGRLVGVTKSPRMKNIIIWHILVNTLKNLAYICLWDMFELDRKSVV